MEQTNSFYSEKRYLQAANVGDSTAFLQRRDQVLQLTSGKFCVSASVYLNPIDHRLNNEEERNRITAAGIKVSSAQTRVGGLAVSRALGDHFLKGEKTGLIADPYLSPVIPLEPTDSLLILASDGVQFLIHIILINLAMGHYVWRACNGDCHTFPNCREHGQAVGAGCIGSSQMQ